MTVMAPAETVELPARDRRRIRARIDDYGNDDLPPLSDFHDFPPDDPPSDGGDGDGGDDDPVEWLTVATFDQPAHAHLARLRLESEQIDCVLIDENLVATDWLISNAVGGIKLQVPEPDAARARGLLSAHHVCPPPDGPPLCPRCGSDRVRPAPLAGPVVLMTILLLGVPLPFVLVARKALCGDCGLKWR